MKVVILTPLNSGPTAGYTASLFALNRTHELAYLYCQGSVIQHQREDLAEAAMKAGADRLLWIDGDQTFPPDALDRLLSHNELFIGCNISTKRDPVGPTARGLDGSALWTGPEDKGTVEVGALGFGLCLISADVFRAVPRPWFDAVGEDYDFCRKARDAGFRIMLDHALSWEIGHVGERIYTNADAMLDRPRWKMKHKQ